MYLLLHLVDQNIIQFYNNLLVFINIGGVREALFGDHNYELIWKERKGFAKVAIDAKIVSTIGSFFFYSYDIIYSIAYHSNVYKKLSRSYTSYVIRSS